MEPSTSASHEDRGGLADGQGGLAAVSEPGVRGVRVRFSFEGGETEVVVPDARLAADVAALFPQGRIEAAEGEADRRAEGRRRDEVLTEAEGGVGAGLRVVPGTDGFVLLTGEGRATFRLPSRSARRRRVRRRERPSRARRPEHSPACGRRDHAFRCRVGVRPLRSGQVQLGVGVVLGRPSPLG